MIVFASLALGFAAGFTRFWITALLVLSAALVVLMVAAQFLGDRPPLFTRRKLDLVMGLAALVLMGVCWTALVAVLDLAQPVVRNDQPCLTVPTLSPALPALLNDPEEQARLERKLLKDHCHELPALAAECGFTRYTVPHLLEAEWKRPSHFERCEPVFGQ